VLVGDGVVLRAPRPDDQAARQAYAWHTAIERMYGHVEADRPMTDDEAVDWYARQVEYARDAARRHWMIERDSALVGVTFLHTIDMDDRRARFAIGLFSPELLGRGTGTIATRLVLSHAFADMGLHRVDLRVLAFNERAIASYRTCGFVVEGRERESCLMDGVWRDDVIMGLLATEFSAE
jgi:RimJ/RimL family protein N-acetyltransferase